jgi:hypothetical protein
LLQVAVLVEPNRAVQIIRHRRFPLRRSAPRVCPLKLHLVEVVPMTKNQRDPFASARSADRWA